MTASVETLLLKVDKHARNKKTGLRAKTGVLLHTPYVGAVTNLLATRHKTIANNLNSI